MTRVIRVKTKEQLFREGWFRSAIYKWLECPNDPYAFISGFIERHCPFGKVVVGEDRQDTTRYVTIKVEGREIVIPTKITLLIQSELVDILYE